MQTVGDHLLHLLEESQRNGSSLYALQDAYQHLVESNGLSFLDPMPEPEPVTVEVGNYLTHTDGNEIEFYARCGTKASLTSEGRLRFVGTDQDGNPAEAILNIERLLEVLREEQ